MKFWRGLLDRLLWTLCVIAGVAVGSIGMTAYRTHPYLIDQVIGGQPAPSYVNQHAATPAAILPPGIDPRTVGETMASRRLEAHDAYRFAILHRHDCPHFDTPGWYAQHHQYPTLMIVEKVDILDRWDESVASDFQVRRWSFDGLKGKWNVWALCDN